MTPAVPETAAPLDTAAADTVDRATATPDQPQPYRELGLKDDEYLRIREILGRRPTDAELAMYSVMWSEHCSYKSSKVHLRQFGEKAPKTDALLVGMGENAGVVDIGDGWAVTFKIESHNHPSYVEPYQGAATGVGGIVRDILSMGARPIAVMDPLRFGPLDAADTRRVLPGIVAGVGGLNVPTAFRPEHQRVRVGRANRRASDEGEALVDIGIGAVHVDVEVRLVPDAPQENVVLVA